MCFCPGFSEPHGRVIEKDCLPPVSPLVEAEMIRIDSVLSNFGDSSGEAPSLVPHQTPQRVKTCKKRTFISIKPHSIKAERRVLYHISEHLGGSARSLRLHCTVLAAHWCTHTTPVFLALGSHLPPHFYRWAWCKASGAGLESV